MSTIVLIAAEKRELQHFLRRVERPIRLQWPVDWSWAAQWKGRRLLLAANGFGATLAGEALDVARARESLDAVISSGFCGALDPALRRSDIFVASQVKTAKGAGGYSARVPKTERRFALGILFSGDHVIQTADQKRAMRAAGGDAVDMEAAAVAERAARWRLPFYCVRAVTDMADEGFACDFNAARRADGRLSYAKLLLAASRNPAIQFPELWRLRQYSASAARALGDFLADCEF